ncbi:MAG: TAT-variant-translocated molybdopterin oxidoreductase [Thermoanaerobaculia bacterium]|nr:TAT-variant-translocated molybdopterin oxidoreductase [Thermoanaerobaculia bacterium]
MANNDTTTDTPIESTSKVDLTGPKYWRSLEELVDSDAFQEEVTREFPRLAIPLAGGVDRRRFLQLMGASMALGGAAACTRQPLEKIVPYVRQPEQRIPGRPDFYATAATLGGYAAGILIESHEGRPTKVEGNPEHPASLGAVDLRTQASVLDLYDPDRSQTLTHLGRIRTWESFVDALSTNLGAQASTGGAGLRILTGSITSPSLAAQLASTLERFPQAKWYQYESATRRSATLGASVAAGQPAEVHYALADADVLLSLDADFLTQGPGSVRYAKDFGRRRKAFDSKVEMNRLYCLESAPTNTGSIADHRLSRTPAQIEKLALALAAKLGVAGASAAASSNLDDAAKHWIDVVAKDLQSHRGRCAVLAGDQMSPELHTLVVGINQQLGNLGSTVHLTEPIAARPADDLADLRALVKELEGGQVQVLMMFGVNPVYDAPADLDFASALQNPTTTFKVHHGARADETAPYCQWHIPATHYLEAWGDARAFDGTTTLQQPLIEPLYGAKSAHEVLAVVLGTPGIPGADLVHDHWIGQLGSEKAWRRAVHDGVIAGSAARALTVAGINSGSAATAIASRPLPSGLELAIRPDPTVWDGRFANNGWLQECPKPISKLTWDNALLISPRTAAAQNLQSGDLVRIESGDRTLEMAVHVQPGHADGVVTAHLGYGRTRAGRVGNELGFDVGSLRTSDTFWGAPVTLTKVGTGYPLASTQEHFSMENRHLVREASVEHYREHPHFAHEVAHEFGPEMSMFPPHPYEGNAWGMAINLSACTGCNACVVACQSENNIAVVGKEQVIAGREMHWLRIDQYFTGEDFGDVEGMVNLPVPCQQCENAPCELVCPVAATVHSDEGLNDMVYNRCVGTRYCSNNCPYKVRRFNFFKYQDFVTPSLKLQRNPDVTVRFRGVMEKCTYCVQRISQARIAAGREDRAVLDGDVVTACQQACPTEAIAFGNINDPEAEVTRWKQQDLNYSLLSDLNTRPRTTYLARINNPNPALEDHA